MQNHRLIIGGEKRLNQFKVSRVEVENLKIVTFAENLRLLGKNDVQKFKIALLMQN